MKRLNVHQGIPLWKRACTCGVDVINYKCGYFLTSRLRKSTRRGWIYRKNCFAGITVQARGNHCRGDVAPIYLAVILNFRYCLQYVKLLSFSWGIKNRKATVTCHYELEVYRYYTLLTGVYFKVKLKLHLYYNKNGKFAQMFLYSTLSFYYFLGG